MIVRFAAVSLTVMLAAPALAQGQTAQQSTPQQHSKLSGDQHRRPAARSSGRQRLAGLRA